MKSTEEKITYYAVVGDYDTKARPRGLMRERIIDPHGTPGLIEERLNRDLEWVTTDQISRYFFRGSNDMYDLEEITEAEAEALLSRWRRKRAQDEG